MRRTQRHGRKKLDSRRGAETQRERSPERRAPSASRSMPGATDSEIRMPSPESCSSHPPITQILQIGGRARSARRSFSGERRGTSHERRGPGPLAARPAGKIPLPSPHRLSIILPSEMSPTKPRRMSRSATWAGWTQGGRIEHGGCRRRKPDGRANRLWRLHECEMCRCDLILLRIVRAGSSRAGMPRIRTAFSRTAQRNELLCNTLYSSRKHRI